MAEQHLSHWLKKIIDDPEAVEMVENSEERIVRAYKEMLSGYDVDPSKILSITKRIKDYDGLVVQRDINYYSICGHHFVPFFGTVSIAYEPGEIIIGLGKLKRLVDVYARRLQIQEDIAKDIAQELMDSGRAKGVFVLCKGTHLCVCARGPKDDTTETITTYACGSLKDAEKQRIIIALINNDINPREENASP